MQWCSNWILCLLNKPEPALLKHNASVWILLKIQAPFMIHIMHVSFLICKYKYYSNAVDWTYPCDIETFDVFLCSCSTNERLGVSGFQVLVHWERRWVTGLMNSDGRQLLINQETVCQPADWKRSPSPMFAHMFAHKHTPVWNYAHTSASRWRFGKQHEHIHRHTHAVHIPFIWIPCACCRAEANHAFPPDSMCTVCYYLCAHTTPSGARPWLNVEIPARCKFWMRSRVQKEQTIKAKTEDVSWGTFMLSLWRIVCHLYTSFPLTAWKESKNSIARWPRYEHMFMFHYFYDGDMLLFQTVHT